MNSITHEELNRLASARSVAFAAAEVAHKIAVALPAGSDAHRSAFVAAMKLYADIPAQRYGLNF